VLDRVTADEVIRRATSGRTGPLLVLCEADTDTPVELFCKLSAGCDEGVTSLAREVVAACLARDLGLPVPVPHLVEIPAELPSAVSDPEAAQRLQASSKVAFGSAKVDNQFSTWSLGSRISDTMLPVALATLVFDAVVENVDRRVNNPNCLVSGDRIRIIDHEMAFPPNAMIIGWRPPWQSGGLAWMDQPEGHIFCRGLKKRDLDFSPTLAVWSGVSDARLQEYRTAVPSEWSDALPAVDEALDRVRNARDNMDGVIAEIERVLQ
jgi:hypothetical protein